MRKKDRMYETQYYKYVNLNPKGKIGGDCVIRAIANALDQSWEQTVRELTELGLKMGFICNDKHTYYKYLKLKGFVECAEPRNYDNTKMTVRAFLTYNNEGTIIANVGTYHVTCFKNNKVEDIWDCSKETMHKYWRKA